MRSANAVYSLGARPVYEALESALAGLRKVKKRERKKSIRGALPEPEHVEDFKPGDFSSEISWGLILIPARSRSAISAGRSDTGILNLKNGGDAEWRSSDSGCRVRQSAAGLIALCVHRTRP